MQWDAFYRIQGQDSIVISKFVDRSPNIAQNRRSTETEFHYKRVPIAPQEQRNPVYENKLIKTKTIHKIAEDPDSKASKKSMGHRRE